ncbi:MAG: hypothetical protein AABY84_04880 [Candidatus Firestonebacteria bacterium]
MPELKKLNLTLNLGFLEIQAEISEEDRQCAWELYTEISTRLSVTGKSNDHKCENFKGEVFIESLDSVHNFFRECRSIMRKFPVGQLKKSKSNHLGIIINDLMVNVLRPFLEKWQSDYRHWWEYCGKKAKRLPPIKRQTKYPYCQRFLEDWKNMRVLIRKLQTKLVEVYKLVDVNKKPQLLPK